MPPTNAAAVHSMRSGLIQLFEDLGKDGCIARSEDNSGVKCGQNLPHFFHDLPDGGICYVGRDLIRSFDEATTANLQKLIDFLLCSTHQDTPHPVESANIIEGWVDKLYHACAPPHNSPLNVPEREPSMISGSHTSNNFDDSSLPSYRRENATNTTLQNSIDHGNARALQAQNFQLQAQVRLLRDRLSRSQHRRQELQEQNRTAAQEIITQTVVLGSLRLRVQYLNAQINVQNSEHDRLRSIGHEHSILQARHTALQTSQDETRSTLSTLESRHQALQSEFNDLLSNFSNLNAEHASLRNEMDEMTDELEHERKRRRTRESRHRLGQITFQTVLSRNVSRNVLISVSVA